MHPNKKRLRRSMMFLNCQKPGLIKDPYIYKPDSIMLDLEDAVAENQKDAARYSLFHALQEIDYHGVERVVRINGLDTPHWKEDIRVCVAGGADTIRIAKTETARDVKTVEEHVLAAEREFGRPEGSTLLMAALESCKGVLNALEVCQSSDRLIGIALSLSLIHIFRSKPGWVTERIRPLAMCLRKSIQKLGAVMGLGLLVSVK